MKRGWWGRAGGGVVRLPEDKDWGAGRVGLNGLWLSARREGRRRRLAGKGTNEKVRWAGSGVEGIGRELGRDRGGM